MGKGDLTSIDNVTIALKLKHYANEKLTFTTVLNEDSFAHCFSKIDTSENASVAKNMIETFQYGKLLGFGNNRYLLFSKINSEDDCQNFREQVRQLDYN